MGPKRGASGDAKSAPTGDQPPSEVDVAEIYFDSAEDTDEDEEVEYDSEEIDEDEEACTDDEIDGAVDAYVQALQKHTIKSNQEHAASGGEGNATLDAVDDPASDSSEDERPNRNTIGDVPLEWYKPEEHIGYDQDGKKIIKTGQKDTLDRMLARNDSSKFLRTVYDAYNDEEIVLSKEEMGMINRIRMGQFPHLEVNPFPDENDYFTRETEIMPLSAAPEPKSRFIPSKWEEKKVVQLVRAIRRGWIKTSAERRKEEKEQAFKPYLLWDDDGRAEASAGRHLAYLPAPKLLLPGHAESYNPPPEYLPTEEERAAIALRDEEDMPKFVPTAFDSLRAVPVYAHFIRERFERCLDLYLCPRGRSRVPRRVKDARDLVPKLPKPRDLQPFPNALGLLFAGHTAEVTGVAPDPTGAWLATSSRDGTVRLWEVKTARCAQRWDLTALESAAELERRGARALAWCPNPALRLLAVAVGGGLLLLPASAAASAAQQAATEAALTAAVRRDGDGGGKDMEFAWRRIGTGTVKGAAAAEDAAVSGEAGAEREAEADGSRPSLVGSDVERGVLVPHSARVTSVSWHAGGDYFASVSPLAQKGAVKVHQLSAGRSQRPFRKQKGGRPVQVLFHPSKPMLFLAAQQQVRIYNLAKQQLVKKLVTGSGVVTSMAVHSSGDHLILGSEDNRLAWYDLDLSTKPYRALRFHKRAVRGVAFHRSYPLFASAADDGLVQVFHGMVYDDLMTEPLIVPLKILRGARGGVRSVAFHPTQPWVFAGDEQGNVTLFINL